jgi:hypothetical protein
MDANKQRRWARIRRQQMTRDLSWHFRDRVQLQISDMMDTARIGRVPPTVQIGMIVNGLLRIAALFAIRNSGASKDDFLRVCDAMFDAAISESAEESASDPSDGAIPVSEPRTGPFPPKK